MSIVARLVNEGRWIEVPGAWWGDSLPDQTWVAAGPTEVVASFGRWAMHELLHWPRLSNDGQQVAAKSNTTGFTYLYRRGGSWTLTSRESYGERGHIFDNQGNLIVAKGGDHAPSQGFRYVDESGRVWWGHETHEHPTLGVHAYTVRGDITIGQGSALGGVIAIGSFKRRLIAPGDCQFIHFRRAGDQLSITFSAKHPDRVVHVFPTVAELAEFPLETQPEPRPLPPPDPKPDPKPEPRPEPIPVSTPNRFSVVQSVTATHGHLLVTNTYQSCGEFVQRVLAAMPSEGWGHVGKSQGEAGADLGGVRVSHDVIWHQPSNMQVDIIINAAANSDHRPEIHGPAHVGWDEIPREHYRPSNQWVPPVPLAGADPKPDEPKPIPPPTGELERLRNDLAAAHATIQAQLERITELDAERDKQHRRADEMQRERDRLNAELDAERNKPAPRCDGMRVFGIRIPCGNRS